jgi:hypothetical protein
MSDAKPKRVRTSKTREARVRSLKAQIVSEWARATELSLPANDVHERCFKMFARADLTVSQREELRAHNWGCRDLTERTHCVWQLYEDGVRAKRAPNGATHDIAYHDGTWTRLTGRLEWRGSGEGYFSRDEPTLLMVRENGQLRSV